MTDPTTLALIGLATGILGGGAGLVSALGPKPSVPSLPAPTSAAPPIQNPIGSQTSNATNSAGPSFLAAAAAPQANQLNSQKSLLGQ